MGEREIGSVTRRVSGRGRVSRPGLKRSGTIQALSRGLQILEAMAEEGGRLPLVKIAQRLGLHLSTTHHLVKTLQVLGYVTQDVENKAYQLASRVFQLAGAAWNQDELATLAEPIVTDLSLKTGETARLAVFSRRQMIIIINKVGEVGVWRLSDPTGAPRPAYCTAGGKVLLAYQSKTELRDYLRVTELRPVTPKTITSARRLQEELERVRTQGYAFDEEEFDAEVHALAAPVFNFSGNIVAALGISGTVWRVTRGRIPELASTVKEMAERLSREIGYRGSYPAAGPVASSGSEGKR